MKFLVPMIALAALLSPSPEVLGPLGNPTNSRASSQRGSEAFDKGEFAAAAAEFGEATRYRQIPETSFNLGTALIAAGDLKAGLEVFGPAVESEQLLTDVRYNAGWAALDMGDLDNAIRAYEEVLKDRSGDQNAKRNLEIALKRREQQQNQQPPPQQQPPDPGDEPQNPDPQDGEQQEDASDIDSVLRSVDQQEKEELDRMRRSRQRRKLNW